MTTELTVPAVDEEAYRQAVDAGLLVHTADPLNAETPALAPSTAPAAFNPSNPNGIGWDTAQMACRRLRST